MLQRLARHFLARIVLVVALCLAALVVAALAVRVPSFWSLLPEPAVLFLVSELHPTSQEEAANAEFLAYWLLAFGAFVVLAAVLFWWSSTHRRRLTPPSSGQPQAALESAAHVER
jgi:hypothetical protein